MKNPRTTSRLFIFVLLLVMLAVVFTVWVSKSGQVPLSSSKNSAEVVRDDGTVVNQVRLAQDFTGAKVAQEDLLRGCAGKDCIPSLDTPKFETAQEASSWLEPDDRVFAVHYNGEVKAYPQRIMNWHEIVNDWFGETPVAVTFCPLCGSALAFERTVDGVTTEFGVSGFLHNSDLVMYDRYEGSLWQQITGEAIVGPAARRDEQLATVPIITVPWSQWQAEHPDTLVLSRDTGFTRNYEQYPYGTYEEDDQLLFGVPELDRSLPLKAVVYGVELAGVSKAYPATVFEQTSQLQDSIGSTPVMVEQLSSGEVRVTVIETQETLTPT